MAAIYVKVDNAIKTATAVYIKVDGVWKQISLVGNTKTLLDE